MSQLNHIVYTGGAESTLDENKLDVRNNIVDKNITVSSDGSPQDGQNSASETNSEEYINNSDSLSSSASISDSDLTSTDSEDSLALSESESITDVTPLNSPYCDSPLCQSRLLDHKADDKSSRNYDNVEIRQGCPPEVNVLMKAIEKLEIEAKKAEQSAVRITPTRRRTVSCGSEDGKRMEQENKLFKRVISQQSRIRTIYPTSSQSCRKSLNNKQQDLVKSDGDISASPENIQSSKSLKDGTKYSQRQQKCLSHPSYMFSSGSVTNKVVLNEGISGTHDDEKISEKTVEASRPSTFKVKNDTERTFPE
ncbi:uncharacterized protein TNCV_2383311 [Trichonephila clavipes]|nr:uncharacterized protein TNCV_2383311 [Trichonephila clavipes]